MTDDLELLRAYATKGSEDAFRTVLERHVNLVHSAALRQVRDPHLAQEVTQAVFLVLARKAPSLSDRTVLAGWFFRTVRFVAARAVRDEQRRQKREQEAAQMELTQSTPDSESCWDDIAPALDEAIAQLRETERHAILLRFFEKKEFKEVGRVLGHSEDAAKKRVARALDNLRGFLAQRGAVLSVGGLAGVLAENAVQAAPAGVAAGTFASVTAKAGTVTVLALFHETLQAMFYAKLKTGALATLALLGLVGGGFALASLSTPPPPPKIVTQFYPISLENLQGKALASYAADNPWSSVPTGAQVLGGVPFQITTKLQLHANTEARDQRFYPERITGIPVRQRLGRLHVFNGANIPDHEGSPMATLRLNYADGSTHTLLFSYAFNTREWWRNPGATNYNIFDTNSVIAWTGHSRDADARGPGHSHRLYRTTFELPPHDSPVETIDMFSLFHNSSLVVLAMTGESPGASAGTAASSVDDTQYRRSLTIHTIDRVGSVVSGVQIRGLAMNERGRALALGKLDDTSTQPGEIPIDFPASTRELRLLISSTNGGLSELNLHSSPEGEFGVGTTVRLEPGVRIGGYVRDSAGRPLEKAKIEMFRAVRNSKSELLLTRYGETKTDAKGRWRIREVPPLSGEYLIRVRLAGFVDGEFVIAGDTGSGPWTHDALLASRAEFTLSPGTNAVTSLEATTNEPEENSK